MQAAAVWLDADWVVRARETFLDSSNFGGALFVRLPFLVGAAHENPKGPQPKLVGVWIVRFIVGAVCVHQV